MGDWVYRRAGRDQANGGNLRELPVSVHRCTTFARTGPARFVICVTEIFLAEVNLLFKEFSVDRSHVAAGGDLAIWMVQLTSESGSAATIEGFLSELTALF
ncbi:MAG: hypothetical protein JO259_13175 [Mycobacterium sp.]|nr:hypothetical protein [Mycobacterium sp.]